MQLGAFSVSLNVRDIAASRDFYGKLGFAPVAGHVDENWLILRNGAHVIGLFQGMFERTMLTFNPGWDQEGRDTESFEDVRQIRDALKARGIDVAEPADAARDGPMSITITDPDGNPILIDQHR